MSPCTKSIASWLARIPCCCGEHPKPCCRRKRSASISAAKGEGLRENGRFSGNNSRLDSDPSPDYAAAADGDEITWQDFASSLDQILFVFFIIFIVVSSLVLFIFWGLEYERNNWGKVLKEIRHNFIWIQVGWLFRYVFDILNFNSLADHIINLYWYLYLYFVLIFRSCFIFYDNKIHKGNMRADVSIYIE